VLMWVGAGVVGVVLSMVVTGARIRDVVVVGVGSRVLTSSVVSKINVLIQFKTKVMYQ
jgi:carbonic anhydrase/acetyltransferase-like protein (isoleucine patch superfamily)